MDILGPKCFQGPVGMEDPVILKGRPIARTKKGQQKILSKAVQKGQLKSCKGREAKKVNKSFIQGGRKKGQRKSWKRMEVPGWRPLL